MSQIMDTKKFSPGGGVAAPGGPREHGGGRVLEPQLSSSPPAGGTRPSGPLGMGSLFWVPMGMFPITNE